MKKNSLNKDAFIKYGLLAVIVISFLYIMYNGIPTTYKYLNSKSEIKAIDIVSVYVTNDFVYSHEVICNIKNISKFLDELEQIDCRRFIGAPISIQEDTIAVKIEYIDGEYEVISHSGRYTYTNEKQFQAYEGYNVFDEEEYLLFINKYLEN